MIRHIYLEREIRNEAVAKSVCERFPSALVTEIDSFGEVFNAKSQNFRLQKEEPAAILAKKYGKLLLQTPPEMALGGKHNYYFSHAYNCLYDCRYCFLQAMYSSAHYVFFVNHQDFADAIVDKAANLYPEPVYFFSGYDCDSLAFEPITGFAAKFVQLFQTLDNAILELRTKSTAIRSLLSIEPCNNVIVAFSLSPDDIASQYDHKAPSIAKRLKAIEQLAERGWNIGFRFDPLIWHSRFQSAYSDLCQQVFSVVPVNQRHSATIGTLRFPKKQYRRLIHLYPEEPLFAAFESDGQAVSYPDGIGDQLCETLTSIVARYLDEDRIFRMAL